MALTVSINTNKYNSYAKRFVDHIASPLKFIGLEITFDASYPTGGYALDYGDYDISDLSVVNFEPNDTYIFVYDRTNKKVKVYSGLGTEVTAGTDLSSVTTYMSMFGY